MSAGILIGCAGWSIRRELQSHFPDSGTHLERYAQRLPAVEINSSFYRPHQVKTYARWSDCTPDAFRKAELREGSMGRALDKLRGRSKRLDLLEMEQIGTAQDFIADNELLDPESADAVLDPIAKRGLAKSWAKGRAMFAARSARNGQPAK